MVSVIVPISYLVFLFGSLAIFSRFYRKNQSKKAPAVPWFPPHKSRDVYISLLSLETTPPRPILVAALLRRAMDDVKLIWSIRDAKQSLTTLLQKGQIGDELWERFVNAEKELEAEIVEVVGEANTFQPGYGNQIFGIASEMVSHERWKEIYQKIGENREKEKAKMANPAPSLALSPTSYLTPDALTLAPSNPLSTTSPNPALSLAPLAPSSVTSIPPSRETTPVPTTSPAKPSMTEKAAETQPPLPSPASNGTSATSPVALEDVDGDEGSDSGVKPILPPIPAENKTTAASTPAGKGAQTPSTTPKKKANMKKKVKGGR